MLLLKVLEKELFDRPTHHYRKKKKHNGTNHLNL